MGSEEEDRIRAILGESTARLTNELRENTVAISHLSGKVDVIEERVEGIREHCSTVSGQVRHDLAGTERRANEYRNHRRNIASNIWVGVAVCIITLIIRWVWSTYL
jgi:hypothetical protein